MMIPALALALFTSQPQPPARYLRTLAKNPDGYNANRNAIDAELLLGDLLFHSTDIFGQKAREQKLSCDTCHPNGATDGRNIDFTTRIFGEDDGIANAVNIPSLRGARYTAPYGRDGRTASLSEFIQNVVVSELGGRELPANYLRALVRYVQDFDFLPNKNLDATNALAGKGAPLFEKHCARCHVPDGNFRDGLAHRHASAERASPHALDDAYETPTLLGLAETAPYFHDGRFATLADVLAWYDKAFALHLDAAAQKELLEYVEAIGAIDQPSDQRPLTRRLAEGVAYLSLLEKGPYTADAGICAMTVAACDHVLTREQPDPSISERLTTARTELAALCRASSAREARAAKLHRDLLLLAADWAGAESRANQDARSEASTGAVSR